MQAITTKTIPATSTRPARIRVYTEDGGITVQGMSHWDAAIRLCECFGWTPEKMPLSVAPNYANMHMGTTKCGYVFVFSNLHFIQEAA